MVTTRFLDPAVLATLSGLELVARSVVDGFINGLHRSPDFGFSQEFAEYRQYVPGDDLRHVDWNVFARTERAYLKRFHGETNSQLTILLDSSKSMAYGSATVTKLDYARYLAASLAYLAKEQRDAAGILVFDDDVRHFVAPSSRQGQLHRVLHAIENAEPHQRTDYEKPFLHVLNLLHRRGVVVLISDFYEWPEKILKTIDPVRHRGGEVILFHVLDPHELNPPITGSTLIVDMENDARVEVSASVVRENYGKRIRAHIDELSNEARRHGIDYLTLETDKPLDKALHEYLTVRKGRF